MAGSTPSGQSPPVIADLVAMRLPLLTPGTGSFFCGSCLRDNVLARALRAIGHEVTVVPLYLPRVLEEPAPEEPVLLGGINMYLQQKSRIARVLPRWLTRVFDRPGLLRWAAKRGNMTDAADLGALALSMLRGELGHQAKEVERLVDWIGALPRPDVLVISNVMLSGVVRRLREAIGCPILSTLQGEAPFLDALPEPFRSDTWAELRLRANEISAFVPVSRTYGEVICERLGLERARVHPVHNGIDLGDYDARPQPLATRNPRTIGYLARMCHDKGLHTLVDAFVALRSQGSMSDVRLRIAGVRLAEDEPFVEQLRATLARHGLAGDVEFSANIARPEKLAQLRSLSVLSVPATYGESFGLYVLEALACGVPVVEPRHGAFAELLEETGGGLLCEPDDAASLAEALAELLNDGARAQTLADAGRAAVFAHFTAERMARDFERVCFALTKPH